MRKPRSHTDAIRADAGASVTAHGCVGLCADGCWSGAKQHGCRIIGHEQLQKLVRLHGYDDCKALFYERPELPTIGGGWWELRSLTKFCETYGRAGFSDDFKPRRPRLILIEDISFGRPPDNLALLESMAGCAVDDDHFYGASVGS
jgi:hypothetical protein